MIEKLKSLYLRKLSFMGFRRNNKICQQFFFFFFIEKAMIKIKRSHKSQVLFENNCYDRLGDDRFKLKFRVCQSIHVYLLIGRLARTLSRFALSRRWTVSAIHIVVQYTIIFQLIRHCQHFKTVKNQQDVMKHIRYKAGCILVVAQV